MKRQIITAILYTAVTAILLGLVYPMVVTGIAQAAFRDKANGQLIQANGQIQGSRLIGQPFTGDRYFHSRPSAAGTGYDAANSSGSNLGPTSKALTDRVAAAAAAEHTTQPVPLDLVTTSASGLDPDITPDAALFQADRIAAARHLATPMVREFVARHILPRQFGLLGEPRINVLQLNRELDALTNASAKP